MIRIPQFLNLNYYKKLETLERGEFGVILRVEEIKTGKDFAAKIPDNIYAEKSNITREIKILQLNHPAINRLVGFSPFDFENERRPVILTKFYTNQTLRKVLDLSNNAKFTNTKKLINIYGIASAMSFLHSHQTIHRDLTPTNILEDDHLYPQITNFSLSQNINDNPVFDSSMRKIFVKTPYYLAPELFVNKCYSYKTDVYSFAIVVYEILTGETPFENLRNIDLLIKVMKQSYRPDLTNNKSIPIFFQKLISNCWSQDPNNRFSFDEIVQLLKNTNDFFNELNIDADEYLNYVSFIDNYLQNPQLNQHPKFSEKGIQKVCLFDRIEKEPFKMNIEQIDLSKFKQLKRIGEGTFGTVYEVINIENWKKYAAKVFKRRCYKNSTKNINILRNELNVLRKLNHPSIVKFIGFNPMNFENVPKPVIITELAVNQSLEEIFQLERNCLTSEFWDDTKKLINIYGIASSMSYLHSQNIIHRNLKPSNILVDELLHPKLADFGFSKDISIYENEKDEILLGTYNYIAPEIYENFEYSKASDVFAFAMILYEILTNEKPFFGSSFYQIMMNITKGFRPEIKGEFPECFKKLIEDCWSQNPKDRPTFDEIIKLLKTDQNFITSSIKQREYFDYVYEIDKHQSRFDIKISQTINYESIYQKQKVVLITDGVLDLKNFIKQERISKDNFSTTYKIIEKEKNTIYSAKESNIEINNLCKKEIDNLIKDISLLSSMNHPYILKFIGYSSVNFDNIHKPVIVTEYASNKSLEDFIDLERNGLIIEDWNDTKKLINIFGIAYCMSYLHSHDIIHYNLKPSNIIIDKDYHPKVCGFGFSKQNLIQKCMGIQSVYDPKENYIYAIPEVLNSGKYTKASDVYSFSLIVYELITKQKPFFNYTNSFHLLKKIEQNLIRPEINSNIPDCYKELIESCWKQNPQERPSFDQIVGILKKDKRFLTSTSIDRDEYLEFANRKYVEPEKFDLQQLMNAADNNDPKALFRFGLLYSKGIAMPLDQRKAARFYEKAASLGYAQAQCNLGKMYLRGYGIQQDKQKAVELFEKAASQGDAKALFNLGVLYFKGNGVEQNYNKAIEYYEKACELNDNEAQFNLAVMFNTGEGVSIDKKRAFELFQKSAKNGNSMAQYNLGIIYQNGIDGLVQKDINLSIKMYQKAADQNLPQAQYNLALLYLNGDDGVTVNRNKAIELLEKAAKHNYEEAIIHLDLLVSKNDQKNGYKLENIYKTIEGKIDQIHNSLFTSFFVDITSTLTYIEDMFINDNIEQFLLTANQINTSLKNLYKESSNLLTNKSNFPSLKHNQKTKETTATAITSIQNEINKLKVEVSSLESRLVQMNKQIQSIKNTSNESNESSNSFNSPNFSESLNLKNIIKKAEGGDAKSQLTLAAFYATGKGGVHMNNEKALKYYLMAADQGNMNAQYAAASYYYYGRGTAEDKNKAFELFLKAAEQGHSKAQFALGHFYQFDKEAVDQNHENAMNWYKKAANQGHEAAKKVVNSNLLEKT